MINGGMSNLPAMEQTQVESEEDGIKKRIEFYRKALKYYRSRALSLETILASKQQTAPIPDEMKTIKTLHENFQELHEGIRFLQSLKECVQMVKNSVTCIQLDRVENDELKRDMINKASGIVNISKLLMKLYSDKISELDVIYKKKEYIAMLDKYGKHLIERKAIKIDSDKDDVNISEEAERQVYKINLIRAIKAMLIGFASVNHPDLNQQFLKYQSPFRRNLTIEDFTETWDVGLDLKQESMEKQNVSNK